MTRHGAVRRVASRFMAGITAFGLVLAGGSWASTAASANAADDPVREKLKQRVGEKMKERMKERQAEKPAPAKKSSPAARIARDSIPPGSSLVSSEIDRMLEADLTKAGAELSPVTNDADFLRRVFVDLTGKPPTPDKLDAFLNDSSPEKRSKLIDELLATDDYARNWSRYWRDVIGYHAINQMGGRFGGAKNFEDWMTEQLQKNVTWDKVATDLITATGAVQDEGRTFLVFAQFENNTPNLPINLAAEASRVFLGIQIQCAQCHDHPYDNWKREQFHEMAAFFARTAVIRTDPADPRSFAVKGREELPQGAQRGVGKAGGRFTAEYQMPDKEDPEKKHTTHPKFLLGQKPAEGLSDVDRRALFAKYVTDKADPWFAKAYVNRIWGQLMGEGFYEPVDDLGPQREARFPAVIDRLAAEWTASGYDVKWLFREVMNTEAYQREIRPRLESAGALPFASVCPTRLSSDQIFDALVSVLGINENSLAGMTRPPAGGGQQARRLGAIEPRGQFNRTFGVDPSTPIDELQGTIPQALYMMNNSLISGQIRAQGDSVLGRLLAVYDDDDELIRLVYKRVLARVPTDNELKTCKDYVKDVDNRREAFEDLVWSLVNSTEFITKR